MATNIGAIQIGTNTSDATATAAQILSGKTAYVKGSKVTGTMTNQGAKTSSLNCGGSYTIPAGYHNGSGKITANSLASQTSATATAAQISSGYTAWVNGSKITGTASGAKTNASFDFNSMDARFTRVFWNKTEGVMIDSFDGTTLSITCRSDDGWNTTFNIILS